MASKTSPTKIRAAERRRQALEYRKAGYGYVQIAAQMGCSLCAAYRLVTRALAELSQSCRETAEEVRDLELQKLDAQEARLQAAIRSLTPAQIRLLPKFEDSLLRVSQQRCKLLGLVHTPQVNVIAPPDTRLEVVLSNPTVQQLAAAAVREAEIIDQTPTHDSGNS
jgi:hypothetical protein